MAVEVGQVITLPHAVVKVRHITEQGQAVIEEVNGAWANIVPVATIETAEEEPQEETPADETPETPELPEGQEGGI